uniref:Uncharacterized protein n=1 Tax=Glossina brevipalpis TaxID=37001 RepID=A0A1A9WCY9_9MUSC
MSSTKGLLVTCFLTFTSAIRIDWNTNKGPIMPAIPTTTVRPLPPYTEPAPVWQDLSDDIPNPNPYIYVPPPPSRPKQRLHTNVNNNNNNKYGTLITPKSVYQNGITTTSVVASLSPQYISNVGTRYTAVVPKSSYNGYKWQGKYNAKTKKYKAYEKVKYMPLNYYPMFNVEDLLGESSNTNSKAYLPEYKSFWLKAARQKLSKRSDDASFKMKTNNDNEIRFSTPSAKFLKKPAEKTAYYKDVMPQKSKNNTNKILSSKQRKS